jgi:predicted flap endonuclease-1-like 5' DNA nuclease
LAGQARDQQQAAIQSQAGGEIVAKIDTIEGIGPALSEKLERAGIKSCEKLLESGGTKKGREDLSEKTGISEAQLLKFVNHADLMRIKGIGGEYSELLECAGVDSVPELGQRKAANLAAKIEAINEEKKLVRSVPTEKTVQGWIDQAKGLPKAVHH